MKYKLLWEKGYGCHISINCQIKVFAKFRIICIVCEREAFVRSLCDFRSTFVLKFSKFKFSHYVKVFQLNRFRSNVTFIRKQGKMEPCQS